MGYHDYHSGPTGRIDDCPDPYRHDCHPCEPPHDPCGPHEHCPPPPAPGQCPVPPPIAPMQFVPGCNTQEQMEYLRGKVNETIHRWNGIQEKCYEALNRCVGAAVSNDVYYERDEVHFETGYSEDDSAPYYIIESKCVDRAGKPIRVKLAVAYNNTTNSGVVQPIQDVSFMQNANAIITAVAPGKNGWVGSAMINGNPMASTPDATKFVAGFNRHGKLKIFDGAVTTEVLKQNRMVDVIGDVIPILRDGAVTEEAQKLTYKTTVCAIGEKDGNGNKVMFFAGNADATGVQGVTAAKIMQSMGVTTAVITAIGAQDGTSYGNNCGVMEYMGKYAAPATGWRNPENYAFWYISKRPMCGWRNRFTGEIADLVQTYGQLANTVSGLDHRIAIAEDEIDDLQERMKNAEDRLASIEAEIDEIQEHLTRHDNEIAALDQRLTTVEQGLAQEILDRKAADQKIQDALDAEIKRSTDKDNEHDQSIANLTTKIDKEVKDRIEADNLLDQAIKAETLARQVADTRLEELIEAETANRQREDTNLQNQIDNILNGSADLPFVKKSGDTMTGQLDMTGSRIVGVGNGVSDNDAVNVSQLAGKLDKSGGTMTGNLILNGAPTANLQAATKKYVDDKVGSIHTDIPIASATVLGGIKVGSNLSISSDGTLSAVGGGSTGGTTYTPGEGITITSTGADTAEIAADFTVIAKKGDLDALDDRVSAVEDSITNITSGTLELPYLKKSGGTMSGNIDMSGNAINNVKDPTANGQAANKKYVDAGDKANADAIATTNSNVTALTDRVAKCESDITKIKSDVEALNTTVNTINNAMTALTARVETCETNITNILSRLSKCENDITSLTTRVKTLETNVTNLTNEIANIKNGTVALPYVKKTGDTMTGNLAMSNKKITGLAAGSADTDAVNVKQLKDATGGISAGSTAIAGNLLQVAKGNIKYTNRNGTFNTGTWEIVKSNISECIIRFVVTDTMSFLTSDEASIEYEGFTFANNANLTFAKFYAATISNAFSHVSCFKNDGSLFGYWHTELYSIGSTEQYMKAEFGLPTNLYTIVSPGTYEIAYGSGLYWQSLS